MPLIKHPKKRGEWVEMQFMARAASHGLAVAKPWGDSLPYDFIVAHGRTLWRVQVKSTANVCRGFYVVACRPPSRRAGGAYTKEEADFLAVFVVPEDVWYIIPVDVFASRRSAIALNPLLRTSKYVRYLEAWHLLKAPVSRQRPSTRHVP